MTLDSSSFVADPELVQALAKRSTPVPCDEDRVLFHQGENPTGIYILLDGAAVLSMTAPNGQVVMRFKSGAGSLLGLPGLIGNAPYSLSAIARKGSTVAFVSREDFNAVMAADPLLSFKVLQVLAAEVHSARQAIFED